MSPLQAGGRIQGISKGGTPRKGAPQAIKYGSCAVRAVLRKECPAMAKQTLSLICLDFKNAFPAVDIYIHNTLFSFAEKSRGLYSFIFSSKLSYNLKIRPH